MQYPLRTVRDAIQYAEDPAGYREYNDRESTEATRVCFVPWSAAEDFERAIMPRVAIGGPLTVAVGDAFAPVEDNIYLTGRDLPGAVLTYFKLQRKGLVRLDPEAHPRKPWLHVVKTECTGIGIAKFLGDNRIIFREGPGPLGVDDTDGIARFVVTYRKLPYKIGVPDRFTNGVPGSTDGMPTHIDPDSLGYEITRYVSREFKPASDTFTLPGSLMQEFRGGPASIIAEPMPKRVNNTHITYTWHMVPEIPLTAGLLRGHVSDAPNFDINGLAQIEGTRERFTTDALYLSSEIGDPYPMIDGTEVRDIKFHVVMRRPGNNFVFRPSLINRGIDSPELPARYQGWTLAFRRLIAGDPDIGTAGMDLPHKPGNTTYPYANLRSLFGLYADAAPFVPVRTQTAV